MKKPNLIHYWNWKDKSFRFDMYFNQDFSDLKNIEQVYTLVLNKERTQVLLAYNRMGLWLLPGGGIEEGESLQETLVREIKEETNREIDIDSVIPFFYQNSFKKQDDGSWKFLRTEVRYIATVSKDNEFLEDPDKGDIVKVEWVPINKLDEYLNWGESSKKIQEELIKFVNYI